MRVLTAVFVLAAGMAQAEDWVALKGADIEVALMARMVLYADGAQQTFMGAGVTTYQDGDAMSAGSWRVEEDKYCSVWPPSDLWACYGVEVSGIDVRFVGEGGEVTVGRFGDL